MFQPGRRRQEDQPAIDPTGPTERMDAGKHERKRERSQFWLYFGGALPRPYERSKNRADHEM